MCGCYKNELMSVMEEVSYLERLLKQEKVQNRTNPTYRVLTDLLSIVCSHHSSIVGQDVVETYLYYANPEKYWKIRFCRNNICTMKRGDQHKYYDLLHRTGNSHEKIYRLK